MLNGLGFSFSVIRFYFAFNFFIVPPSYIFTLLSTAVPSKYAHVHYNAAQQHEQFEQVGWYDCSDLSQFFD